MLETIETWLSRLGLGKYTEVFVENDIDHRALPHLTEADLRELGVSLGHRKVLLAAITELSSNVEKASNKKSNEAINEVASSRDFAPDAERRLLSILFCDLVGSTALSEQLDPEDLRELIRRYQDAVAGCVTRYGGHVAKYLGDGVLAYFGWPKAYEDQAERAVRAGIEALAAVSGLSGPGVDALAARVGVATGQVIVGDLVGDSSREEGAVAGHTPNLAARLQDNAEPGTLLIAHTTRQLIASAFEIEALGARGMKGFEQEIDVFRVVRERPVDSRFEAAQGGTILPFVGRVHELGMLLDRWDLAQSGQGQLVFVSGEAGIGKSRLIEAFCDSLDAEQPQLIRMQCSPYLSNSAYHPVIERLSRAAGFALADPAAARLQKLEQLLQGGGEDLASVIPVYAELLSIRLDARYQDLNLQPQALKELTLKTLVERVGKIAGQGPTVLILEDAHWIDPSTRDVFERLIPRIKELPALVIITHRTDWSAEWAAGYPHGTTISIGRIGREHIVELVKAVIGAEPGADLIDEIVARTDGVPLFVVELARSILESGATDSNRRDLIPASLHGSLTARLDRLPAEVKSVAQMASAIGRDFDRDLLAKVVGIDVTAMQEAVDQLQRTQIIMRSAVSSDAFAFRHALIQDTAYQSLLTSRRRAYHDIIAEVLVADYPETAETQPELIARHLTEAERLEEALPLWKRATERALARWANFEAVGHSERALSIAAKLQDPQARERETLATEILHAHALSNSGGLTSAMSIFMRAAERARALGDAEGFVEAALGLDNAVFISNERSPTIEILTEALTMVGEIDGQIRCQVLGRLARAFLMDGDYGQAHAYNAQALEIARRLGDELVLFDVQVNDLLMPTGGRSRSESERRRAQVDEMLAIAERLNDNNAQGRALSFDTYFAAEIGDRARLDRALAALTELGESREMMHILWIARHGQAMQALLEGDFGEAERHAEAALELVHGTHRDSVEGVYGVQMFTIRREQGRLAEVAPIIKRMVDENPGETAWRPGFALIACDLGFTEPARRILEELAASGFSFALDAKRSTTLAYLAEVCATLGEERYAEALYDLLKPYRHMTITTGVMTVCYGAAARYLGQLASVMGDWDGAQKHFEAALSMNADMGALPWLAHSQHDYALMLQRRNLSGDADAAHELVQESLATAKRLDMVALQSKLQGLVH